MIRNFLPDLVTATSGIVQPVSDQCLAKGLIPESVYTKVLESGETSKDKARTLILAIKTSTETDSKCFEIFLVILGQQLTCNKLLSDIRKRLDGRDNACREVVPIHLPQDSVYLESSQEVPKETALLQSAILSKYEDSIRQHERVRSAKDRLEKDLKEKTEEYNTLKEEFEALKSQTRPLDEAMDHTKSRLTACEEEVETLKTQFRQLENTIEEKDTQLREERNKVMIVGRDMVEDIKKQKEEIKDLRSKLANQERENKEAYIADRLTLPHYYLIHRSVTRNHPRPSFWKRLGKELGLSPSELEDIERIPRRKHIFKHERGEILRIRNNILFRADDWFRLEEMLRQWLRQHPGDSRGSTTFPAYSKLHTSLVKIKVESAARDLCVYNYLTSYHPK